MVKALQALSYRFKVFLGAILILGGIALPVFGQSQEPVAIIGFNSGPQQQVLFLSLQNVDPGANITFFSREWDGATWRREEGELTYTVPAAGLKPGEVVEIEIANRRSSNGGAVDISGGFRFESNGEKLEAHAGAGNPEGAVTPEFGDGPAPGYGIYRGPREGGIEYIKSQIRDGLEHWMAGSGAPAGELMFDRSDFDLTPRLMVQGSESWRMLTSPAADTRFEDLLAPLWMQGIAGSDAPSDPSTLYAWDETAGGFTKPAGLSETMLPGRGYAVFVFEDNDLSTPGTQGGFPKVLDPEREEISGPVQIQVSSTDRDGNQVLSGNEGWNLLANPFGTDLSAQRVLEVLQKADTRVGVNRNILVWDYEAGGGNGAFLPLEPGNAIEPFQPFWVRFDSVGLKATVNFDQSVLAASGDNAYYGDRDRPFIQMQLGNGSKTDSYRIELNSDARPGNDRFDAFKLVSLNKGALSVFSRAENGTRISKNAIPDRLDHALEIPLAIDVPSAGSYTFSWTGATTIPDHWKVTLTDRMRAAEIDLRRDKEYIFTITQSAGQKDGNTPPPVLNSAGESGNFDDNRFVLSINPGGPDGPAGELPESVKLNPNYPNPFNPSTTIPYELQEESRVILTIWNIVGQKVATLVDGMVEAGQHEVAWNASDMPSGIYIVQLEVGGTLRTRKVTLIK